MLYANLLLNVLYHIEIEMKIRESCLQTGNFIYKPGISLTKQDFHLQRGSLGLQRGFSGYYLPAKYHVDEKIWTIKESQREKFAQYLNPENMHAAHKNEPQSPEERVRLNIPKNLDKDEFLRMIQYFKENGAKYQPDEKVWTIGKSQKDSFEKYIMTDTNESNSTLGNVEEIKLSEEEINTFIKISDKLINNIKEDL